MTESLFDPVSPVLFFKGEIDRAVDKQQIEVNELTRYYLVDLLFRFMKRDRMVGCSGQLDEPLAFRLASATSSVSLLRYMRLRNLGDMTLFMTGFFPDSFRRRSVDVDYYISMGEYAYGVLSNERYINGPVFSELARKFVPFMDVLSTVSEECQFVSDRDLLRLYERWLRTGSMKDGRRLAKLGIAPNAAIGKLFIQ